MRETKQYLIDRWTNIDHWIVIYGLVIETLKKGRNLADISGIPMFNGMIDLRGISFPKEYTDYLYKGKFKSYVGSSLTLKHLKLENIDFTYSDIQVTKFKHCSFRNVIFNHANCGQLKCVNCEFEDVIFKSSRLTYSYLNIRSGKKSGSFKNVKFIKSLLNETKSSFPVFKNCLFEDCNLCGCDFDGSRFEDCTFYGKVKSPWFRKHSKNEYEPNLIFNQINKRRFTNQMQNIDFTQAQMDGIGFSLDLELMGCKFPSTVRFERMEDYKIIWADS